jgi:hypothetical protein
MSRLLYLGGALAITLQGEVLVLASQERELREFFSAEATGVLQSLTVLVSRLQKLRSLPLPTRQNQNLALECSLSPERLAAL